MGFMSKIRISASRLKTLWECTLKFYYQEIQGLPDNVHWRTRVGSITHLVFECLMRKDRLRRFTIFREIMMTGVIRIRDHSSLVRFIQWQLRREGIDDKATVDDIGELLQVAFTGIRPYFTTVGPDGITDFTPPPDCRNEQRFQLTLSSGAVISGFIDLLLLWPDRAVCIDLKTQREKFVRAELPSNVQSALYQMATYKEHGIVPTVDFILLRHAPTVRTPDKHIQRVSPHSLPTLCGLESYINSMYARVNGFTWEDALSSPCRDEGFCFRVCTHYAPHPYWLICKADDPEGKSPLSSHLSLDKARQIADSDGYIVIERQFNGCAVKWRE